MTHHFRLSQVQWDQAMRLLLGQMDSGEECKYLAELEQDLHHKSEVVALLETFHEIANCIPPIDPPKHLKRQVFQHLGLDLEKASDNFPPVPGAQPNLPSQSNQPWKGWDSSEVEAGLLIVRGGDEGWVPTGFEGVETKKLFVDRTRDRTTHLVRMAAGSTYPPHLHGGAEECYVIQGDIYGATFSMNEGDFQYAADGSLHGTQATTNGCLLLIVSSLHDELVAPESIG